MPKRFTFIYFLKKIFFAVTNPANKPIRTVNCCARKNVETATIVIANNTAKTPNPKKNQKIAL
jgi:hypothetical protein